MAADAMATEVIAQQHQSGLHCEGQSVVSFISSSSDGGDHDSQPHHSVETTPRHCAGRGDCSLLPEAVSTDLTKVPSVAAPGVSAATSPALYVPDYNFQVVDVASNQDGNAASRPSTPTDYRAALDAYYEMYDFSRSLPGEHGTESYSSGEIIICPSPAVFCTVHSDARPSQRTLGGVIQSVEPLPDAGTIGEYEEIKLMCDIERSSLYESFKLYIHRPSLSKCLLKRVCAKSRKADVEQLLLNTPEEKRCRFITQYICEYQGPTARYIVAAQAPCGSLSFLLDEMDLSEEMVSRIAYQLVIALDYLSLRDIAHRFLCPENILVTQTGSIQLANFCFATVIDCYTRAVCGAKDYRSPEMLSGRGYDTSIDWWALGVLVFFLACRVSPFNLTGALNEDVILNNTHNGYRPGLTRLVFPDLSDAFVNFVASLLNGLLSHRFRFVNGSCEAVKQSAFLSRIHDHMQNECAGQSRESCLSLELPYWFTHR